MLAAPDRRRQPRARTAGVAPLLALLLAACGGGADGPPPATQVPTAARTPSPAASASPASAPAPPPAPTPAEREFEDGEERTARALERAFPRLDLARRTVSLADITPVLPPDGIPAIDAPRFEAAAAAGEWLAPQEPVIAFGRGGEARAYPLQIMTWHEIVNDTVGGEPVIVTYCPLCNSAIAFSRVVGGETRTFGVSGSLRRSDLIMYDRETQTLWQQFTGEAIVGRDAGAELEFLPAQLVSFAEFAAAWPDGLVLTRETGHARSYGENPYALYDTRSATLFPAEPRDGRLPAKERVLALELNGETAAFPFGALAERLVIEATVGGEAVVAFWQPGQVSALDGSAIAASRGVGSAGAFRPVLGGERLTFEARGGAIADAGTGSRWDALGRAVEGPLAGARLEPLVSGSHFWFAWAAFRPDTRVVRGDGGP